VANPKDVAAIRELAAGEWRVIATYGFEALAKDAPGELGKLLPVIYSWTLADLLGFNLDCKGKDAELCSQAKQASRPPIEAYDLGCKHPNRPSCRLPVIEHPPVAVPLERFSQ